ncbi:MAG: thiosulfate oxidation carrier complex protein SoxZ [Alphaproteobacteria bacterium]|nr:thiosulfate oxidation carrier complex protein SoxZ [Alphaproteobacteria bacterium]
MAKVKPRVKVPRKAAPGDVITIKTLISHPMESGQRKDKKTGELIPRKIINRFDAKFEGEDIFSVDIAPAVSANPYFEFSVTVPGPGEFQFSWVDDDGSVYETKKKIKAA